MYEDNVMQFLYNGKRILSKILEVTFFPEILNLCLG
jgi:hypothetical protein